MEDDDYIEVHDPRSPSGIALPLAPSKPGTVIFAMMDPASPKARAHLGRVATASWDKAVERVNARVDEKVGAGNDGAPASPSGWEKAVAKVNARFDENSGAITGQVPSETA